MMKIMPLLLEIVLHYYSAVDDYPIEGSPAGAEIINDLLANGILKRCPDPGDQRPQIRYLITERGQAYVAQLEDVQFPVSVWMTPERKKDYTSNGICSRCNQREEDL